MRKIGNINRLARPWLWRLSALVVAVAMSTALLSKSGQVLIGTVSGSTADGTPPACPPGDTIAIMDSPHISRAEGGGVRYNSTPATSGPHFAFTVTTGIYRTALPDGLTVHALEHGHVAIQYAENTPAATIGKLERLAEVRAKAGADVVHAVRVTGAGAAG